MRRALQRRCWRHFFYLSNRKLGGRLCDKLGVLAENGDVVDAVEELGKS